MQVTVTQTLMFDELPHFLERLGVDIEDLIHQIQESYAESDEHFQQERFTAYAGSLDEVRALLARADVKLSELRNLTLNYQQALFEMENANSNAPEPAQVQEPLEEGGDV